LIDAVHLDRSDGILDAEFLASDLELSGHCLECPCIELDSSRLNQHLALKITDYPFGPSLSAIDSDNSEMGRPDGLYPFLDKSSGFSDVSGLCGFNERFSFDTFDAVAMRVILS